MGYSFHVVKSRPDIQSGLIHSGILLIFDPFWSGFLPEIGGNQITSFEGLNLDFFVLESRS
jgi:hypothetical protein